MALLSKVEAELKERQQQFLDDLFEKNQAALTAHRAMITDLYEPSPETIAINKVLEPLGFSHGGNFYPVEFPFEEFEWIEIGCSAIAYTNTYIAVLNYSIVEYWEVPYLEASDNNSELIKSTVKAVKELEKVDG
jgi:hypothetical protein